MYVRFALAPQFDQTKAQTNTYAENDDNCKWVGNIDGFIMRRAAAWFRRFTVIFLQPSWICIRRNHFHERRQNARRSARNLPNCLSTFFYVVFVAFIFYFHFAPVFSSTLFSLFPSINSFFFFFPPKFFSPFASNTYRRFGFIKVAPGASLFSFRSDVSCVIYFVCFTDTHITAIQ